MDSCHLEHHAQHGTFAEYLWSFVDGVQIRNRWPTLADIPARTELSDRISKEWKRRGLKFVGSTIVYAYLQGVGVVNDHIASCFRHGFRRAAVRKKA